MQHFTGKQSTGYQFPGYDGVHAYDASTGNIKWKVFEKLPGMEKAMRARGIAADDCGYLFVCDDDNQCVQMLSLKGDYLRSVLNTENRISGYQTEYVGATRRRLRYCSPRKERTLLCRRFY